MLHAVLILCVLQGELENPNAAPSHAADAAERSALPEAAPAQQPPHSAGTETVPLAVSPTSQTEGNVKRGALPIAASVVPGLLLHGSGHYAAGHRKTAWSLLKWQGVGIGLVLGGATGLGLTGAARQTVGLFALTTMAGSALFITSWLADMYGVIAPMGGWGSPRRNEAWLEAGMGVRYVRDPTLAAGLFLGPSLSLRLRRWRWSPGAWLTLDNENANARFENTIAYRAYGPLPSPGTVALDGSYVDFVTGVFHHRYRERVGVFASRFQITSFDARVEARLDLQRLAPSLAGAFIDGNAGVGLAAYRYPVASTTEASSVLIGGFGFGMYFGRAASRWGQMRMYYNHRHDDLAGGLKAPGVGSGALGHFGADGIAYVSRHWGVRAEVQAGSAWVTGLSALYRYGSASL